MSLKYRLLNSLCGVAYKAEYKRFEKLVRNEKPGALKDVQIGKLINYISENADTEYGKRYNFKDIKCYEDFAANVPLTTYEDYEDYIEKIAAGEKNILTKEDVLMFELTSGSSGGKKMIPYTKTLKEEFQCGIYPWLYDINKRIDGVKDGTSYWSITPVTTKKTYTKAGIPIGFEEDAEYFGKFVQGLMNQIFAVNSKNVKFVADMDEFYHKTAIGMIKGDKLSLISVWNPTFLSILSDYIKEHATELEHELELSKGTIEEPATKDRFDKIFKNLKLISCWADGNAKNQVEDIKNRYPGVYIQPKGILATECFISFPFMEKSRLSVRSHFFEFRDVKTGEICLADGLKAGEYEVIITTGGGFYRYQIGDIIEVVEADGVTPPVIRFLRRSGATTDICGEKLSDDFVRACIKNLGLDTKFNLLSPEKDGYILYTEDETVTSEAFDDELKKSFHYNYCRELGQLKCVKVVRVNNNAIDIFYKRMIHEGIRMGDIKPTVLTRFDGWEEWFL